MGELQNCKGGNSSQPREGLHSRVCLTRPPAGQKSAIASLSGNSPLFKRAEHYRLWRSSNIAINTAELLEHD
jgi:hypothetical protein